MHLVGDIYIYTYWYVHTHKYIYMYICIYRRVFSWPRTAATIELQYRGRHMSGQPYGKVRPAVTRRQTLTEGTTKPVNPSYEDRYANWRGVVYARPTHTSRQYSGLIILLILKLNGQTKASLALLSLAVSKTASCECLHLLCPPHNIYTHLPAVCRASINLNHNLRSHY